MKVKTIKDKIFDVTEHFASKTGDYALITKRTMEVKSYQTKISALNEKLGALIYDKMANNPETIAVDTAMRDYIGSIREYNEKIQKTTDEIAEIRKNAEEAKKAEQTEKAEAAEAEKNKNEETAEDNQQSENTDEKKDEQ